MSATTIKQKTIWIDMDNTPHVVFFKPIIKKLESHGYRVVVTARNCFQVCGLADLMGISYIRIGKHYGKNKLMKVVGLIIRTLQLLPFAFKIKPFLTLSHGSRSQLVLSNILHINSILIFDYEHAKRISIAKAKWYFAPQVVIDDMKLGPEEGYYSYPGIKEDVYVSDFVPDKSLRTQLGISEKEIMVTLRPPATEAHYHNPEADKLLVTVIELLNANNEARIVLVPRNDRQKKSIADQWPELFASNKIIVPPTVDGLNLIWNSDLIISGGGTMNREAAALNVPVYSIFRGPTGSVDKYLEKEHRLIMLTSSEDVEKKLIIRRRERGDTGFAKQERKAIDVVVDTIVKLVEGKYQ